MTRGRSFWPKPFRKLHYWVEWWAGGNGSELYYQPTVILDCEIPVAILGITNYRPEYRTAEMHFCASSPFSPVGVKRAVDRFFSGIADSEEISILYGHLPASFDKGIRTARLFGFKEIAKIGNIWYSAKSLRRRN